MSLVLWFSNLVLPGYFSYHWHLNNNTLNWHVILFYFLYFFISKSPKQLQKHTRLNRMFILVLYIATRDTRSQVILTNDNNYGRIWFACLGLCRYAERRSSCFVTSEVTVRIRGVSNCPPNALAYAAFIKTAYSTYCSEHKWFARLPRRLQKSTSPDGTWLLGINRN